MIFEQMTLRKSYLLSFFVRFIGHSVWYHYIINFSTVEPMIIDSELFKVNENMRKLCKAHLRGQGLGTNTVNSVGGEELLKALSENSTGNAVSLVNGCLSALRCFRNSGLEEKVKVVT